MKVFKFVLAIIIELIFIAGFLISCFAVVNTMVSIKYETETGVGCISSITGENLCVIKNLWLGAAVLFLVLSISWVIYAIYKSKRKNLRPNRFQKPVRSKIYNNHKLEKE